MGYYPSNKIGYRTSAKQRILYHSVETGILFTIASISKIYSKLLIKQNINIMYYFKIAMHKFGLYTFLFALPYYVFNQVYYSYLNDGHKVSYITTNLLSFCSTMIIVYPIKLISNPIQMLYIICTLSILRDSYIHKIQLNAILNYQKKLSLSQKQQIKKYGRLLTSQQQCAKNLGIQLSFPQTKANSTTQLPFLQVQMSEQ